jgi:hypothetical protein
VGADRRRRLHQGPITAQGITDAFHDAERYTNAIDARAGYLVRKVTVAISSTVTGGCWSSAGTR